LLVKDIQTLEPIVYFEFYSLTFSIEEVLISIVYTLPPFSLLFVNIFLYI
jgi:hypothetical protein